jgi:putative transposase
MRKSRFSEAQIAEILKEGESGVPLTGLIRKHGISRPTYFNRRTKYGGVSVSELKRLKDLEAENAKLKRMYADLALENTAIKDVLNRKL